MVDILKPLHVCGSREFESGASGGEKWMAFSTIISYACDISEEKYMSCVKHCLQSQGHVSDARQGLMTSGI